MKLGFIVNAAEAERQMKETLANSQQAILAGVTESTNEAKAALREMTRAAFKGGKLPNTWQSKVYGRDSFNPAGMIYSKAPELMRAFSKGVLVKSADGFYLAIPTENAPKKGRDGKRISPSNWPKEVYGPLRFVYRPNGRSLLVADDLRASYSRKTGQMRGFKAASAKQRAAGKVATVIMFWLVPQVKLDKRIDPEPAVKSAGSRIPDRITARLKGGK